MWNREMWSRILHWLRKVRMERQAAARARRRPYTFKPCLEGLAERIVPTNTACTFANLNGTNLWSDPLNWEPIAGRADPRPDGSGTDTAFIQANCVNNTGADIAALTVQVGSTLNVASGITVENKGTAGNGSTFVSASSTMIIGSSDPHANASLDTQSFNDNGIVTVGGPSGGSTGTLDTVFADMGGGTLNIGDPGSGTGGTMDISNNMSGDSFGHLNVGGAGGSPGLIDANILGTGDIVTVNNSGKIDITSSAVFSNTTTVLGQIEAETGASVLFSGTDTIGPGTLDGNLKAGINGSFTFAGPLATLVSGATLGDGKYFVDGAVRINGALSDTVAEINVDYNSGVGDLYGPGSIDDWADFDWTGGTIDLNGGITIEPTAEFKADGAGLKTLASGTITNISSYTSLGGTGDLAINTGAIFDNAIGNVDVTIPAIVLGGPMGGTGLLTNTGGNSSTLDFQSPSSTPTVISANFINNGVLAVAGGDAATLEASAFGGGVYNLDGTLSLEGDLTLEGAIASPTGVIVNGGGRLLIGNGSAAGSLTLAGGTSMVIGGNVEVTGAGTLTGGGEVDDNGKLTLDVGSAAIIGSYQQSSIGTLDVQAASGMMGPSYSTLTVSGTAQLSGILSIDFVGGYTPPSGTVFTVLTAGSIGAHFDSTPPDMTPTYGPTSVTLTQN